MGLFSWVKFFIDPRGSIFGIGAKAVNESAVKEVAGRIVDIGNLKAVVMKSIEVSTSLSTSIQGITATGEYISVGQSAISACERYLKELEINQATIIHLTHNPNIIAYLENLVPLVQEFDQLLKQLREDITRQFALQEEIVQLEQKKDFASEAELKKLAELQKDVIQLIALTNSQIARARHLSPLFIQIFSNIKTQVK